MPPDRLRPCHQSRLHAFLSEQLGNLIGILATGALVFVLAPLQRSAEGFADQAMPSVTNTAEYKNFRKLQIHGEAVAESMHDGKFSPVERVVLNRLRQQLGLSDEEAAAFEQELGMTGVALAARARARTA